MGNKLSSNPLKEEDMEKVNKIINVALSQFASEFAIHYKDAVVADVQRQATQPEKDAEHKLLPDFPVPDYVLKSGLMSKKGAPAVSATLVASSK